MILFRTLLTTSLLVAFAAPGSADTRSVAEADAFRRETRELLATALEEVEVVPSITVTVVVGDQVVLAEGFGDADRENGIRSTDETLYYIASATKPYTALAAAILDHRGEISLDDPLSEHLHGADMDPVLSPEKVQLRDLLSHTSGISNKPIATRLAFTGEHDPDTLWWLLARSEPAEDAPLGTFKYTNVGYNILGMILDRELGKPWQDLLRDELFAPLDMPRTTAYASLPERKGWPKAAPYLGVHPDGIQRINLEKTDETMQSAGGMLTTALDVGRFLELQLNDGKVDGRQLIPADVIRRTHEKLTDAEGGRPPFGRTGYGLGWSHGTWRDRRVLYHGGGFAGFFSRISFMPDEGIGVAVFTNEIGAGSRLAGVASTWAYDWWLDVGEDERAAEEMLAQISQVRAKIAEHVAADFAKRAEREWKLSRSKEAYAGTYTNELYGTVSIAIQEGEPTVAIGNLRCVATPYTKAETMRVELVPGQGEVIAFEPAAGDVERLVWDGDIFERIGGQAGAGSK
jgi:CubicO group peptidase (beta-lactamase class C family)